jgi:signal transduction histidine kinase
LIENVTPAILIVDDDPLIREFVSEITRDLLPKDLILEAVDGEDAMRILHDPQGKAIRLVITDIRMPILGGVALSKEIDMMRSRGETQAQCIVITGANLPAFEMNRLKSSGVHAILSKPFHVKDFSDTLLQGLQIPLDEYQTVISNAQHIESLIMLGEMSASIVHELRNPLMILASCVTNIKKEIVKPECSLAGVDQMAEKIHAAVVRIEKVINSVCSLTHKEDVDNAEVFTVKALEEQGLHLLRLALKDRDVSLRFEFERNVFLKGSFVQLIQVITNLCNNAADAIEELPYDEQWIKVSIKDGEKDVVISVENGGPLIPPEIRERMFTRYFTTKPKGKGTGLGLPLCRAMAERNHGSLTLLDNTPHTCFEVRIPRPEESELHYPLAL